jgi:hypothetical protein
VALPVRVFTRYRQSTSDCSPRPSASSRLHTVWRRQYGGMDTDAAKELKELREQNSRLKRLLADAELEKDALREVARGKF